MNYGIKRRDVLRGVGACLALPWMESLSAAGPVPSPKKSLAAPPLRSAFLFMPNGVVPENWTPKGDGEVWESTPMLQPLWKHKEDLLLVENLWNEKTNGRNGHWPKVPAWLSGGFVERGHGGDLDTGGTSADQLMARAIGHRTALPSLELGVDTPRSGIDNVGGGFPRILGSYISWRDPHTPVPKETVPQQAFDRLFRTGNTLPLVKGMSADDPRFNRALQRDDTSVLDLVLEDAKALRSRVSQHDQGKLDEYLESVRSVEKRIEASINPPPRWINDNQFAMSRPGDQVPDRFEDRMKLMLDIMILAFWTDTTRICTFMMADAQTGRSYDFLDGVSKRGFHSISHHRNDADDKGQYERIGTWHVEQFAYLLNRMKSLDEAGTSLLDNCQLLFGSSLKDGNNHNPHDLPLVVAGKAQGKFRTGRRVRANKDTPMCNLLMTMMANMDVKPGRFGDSTGLLGKLS